MKQQQQQNRKEIEQEVHSGTISFETPKGVSSQEKVTQVQKHASESQTPTTNAKQAQSLQISGPKLEQTAVAQVVVNDSM